MNELPPGSPGAIPFIARTQRGRLPVALAAEAVAVGHQPLHREPGQLRQAVQVLEGGGEGPEAASSRKARIPISIRAASRRDERRSPPGAAPGPRVAVVVLGTSRPPRPGSTRVHHAPPGHRCRSRGPNSPAGSAPRPCRPRSRPLRACCRRSARRGRPRSCQAAGRAHPDGQLVCTSASAPVADDNLALEAHAACPMKPNSRSPCADWLRFM